MTNRYVIKFSKTGYIKYTSHLDLMRAFKRAFKMAGLGLRYSQGFNPHPKMSFAQPLSLGYSSKCELIELETNEHFKPVEILDRIEGKLPEGIETLGCYEFNDNIKSLASISDSAKYRIYVPSNNEISIDNLVNNISKTLGKNVLNAEKKSKKSKEVKEINIKPMIRSYEVGKLGEFATIDILLDSGSQSNLSPELVIQVILNNNELNIDRTEIEVERTGLFFKPEILF